MKAKQLPHLNPLVIMIVFLILSSNVGCNSPNTDCINSGLLDKYMHATSSQSLVVSL